jgi:hypothetical protein
MKYLFLTLLASALFSQSALSQNISCDDFSITGINQSTFNPSQYLVSIQFNGSNSDFINEPFVSSIMDGNGDTIASGRRRFFGQRSDTVQDYIVTSTGNMNATQFKVIFDFNYGDTCFLSFTNVTASLDSNNLQETISVWPNPVKSLLNTTAPANLIGSTYSIYDFIGKSVLKGRFNSENMTIDLDNLEPGIYLLDFIGNLKQPIKIIKK